jgi:hypothetical protein
MEKTLMALVSVLACIGAAMAAAQTQAQGFHLRTIMQSGNVISGTSGSVVTRIGAPKIAQSGALAFTAEYEGGSCPAGHTCTGLFLSRGGSVALAASNGQEVPGLPGARLTGEAEGISLNNAGAVAFVARYYGAECSPPGNVCLVVLVQTGTATTVIAKQGGAVPGSGGGVFTMEIGSTALNDRGQVSFEGSYREGKCTLSGSCGGVYLASGGAPTPIATWNQGIAGMGSARFYDVQKPSINGAVNIAVRAFYKGDCEPGTMLCLGIFIVRGVTRAVALQGNEAQGTGGGRYVGGKGSFGFGPPALNNRNMVAYVAEFSRGACAAATCGGLFRAGASGAPALAYVGLAAPGTSGGVFEGFSDSISMNDAGEVAFHAVYRGGNCPVSRCVGVFVASAAGTLGPVALRGQPLPATANEFFQGLGVPSINNHGTVSFSATTASGRFVVMLADPVR